MKLITVLFFMLVNSMLLAQKKKAILFIPESNMAGKQIPMLTDALEKQGFKNEIAIAMDKESFINTITTSLLATKKGGFCLFYFYQPVIIHQPENETVLLLDTSGEQYISLNELTTLVKNAAKKINDPTAFFCIFDSDLSSINTTAATTTFVKELAGLNSLFATQPGEKNNIMSPSSLLASSFSYAITSGSSYSSTYHDLLHGIERNMILYTSRQRPALYFNGSKSAIFNNLFIKSPVSFSIKSQSDNNTVIINAGQGLNILPGTVINFYPANLIDTSKKMVVSGIVTSSDDITATVRLTNPFPDANKLAAVLGWNENEKASITPLTFNTNFSQSGDTQKNNYFEAIVKGIKEDPRLQQYVKFVSTGGDLQISTIGLLSKDSISCTVINPRTGRPLKDFYYSSKTKDIIYNMEDGKKYSEVGDYLVNSAEWQYLSKLHNKITELQAEVSFTNNNNQEIQKENGDPIVYENDELNLVLHNPQAKKLYFAVIALRTDKSVKLLYPGLGQEAADYQIFPGKNFTSEIIKIPASFGVEKLKIVTSTVPVDINELREKNILTRKKENTVSFLPEYVNIQDFEYEIRSRAYATEKSGKKLQLQPVIADKKILVRNSSAEKVFFNVLQLTGNGDYTIILPNKKYPATNCGVEPSVLSAFTFDNSIEKNTQLVTIYTDRPFLLTQYQSEEKSLNDLLVAIIRNGSIPGSPLNKITLTQQLYTEKNSIASRGNSIVIKLISPKISPEKNLAQQSVTEDYTINGFALTEENDPVKTIKINGETVDYDRTLKFFDKIIQLAPGTNKIVIEATDDKGFTESKIMEVVLQNNNSDATARATNYFLGIGIDKYNVWPSLFNAKNDIDSLSKTLQTKFGYLPANMKVLTDSDATRKNIIKHIRTFLVFAKPNDNIIIYFSGHGNKDQLSDGDYYFIPSDGEADDVSSNVKSTDIMDNFKNIKAKHCLLIMDACFSGLISNSVNKQQISVGNANKNLADLPSKWIITSGRATKVSDGIPGTNSPFAAVMLSYLKDNMDETKLTISKLIDYLKDNVPKFNKQQIPFGTSIAGEGELQFRIVK